MHCKLEFSPEELAIIKHRHLFDLGVYSQTLPDGEDYRGKLEEVIRRGIRHYFNTPIDAKNFEAKLSEDILPWLKKYIADSENVRSGPKILEF